MTWLGDAASTVFGALYTNPVPAGIATALGVVLLAIIARRRGLDRAARRHPVRSLAGILAAAMVILPLAWYLGSPLVLTASIDEAEPSIAPIAARSPSARPSQLDASAPATTKVSAGPSTPPASRTTTAVPERSGTFQGSDDFHFGRGIARLIEIGPGSYVVRLEDFAVRNGPDLYVYLSPSRDGYAPGAIELGRLKADTGNQNYSVPVGTLMDPPGAASVVVWCKQFSHLFATAPLAD
jgi:hypothetical protein